MNFKHPLGRATQKGRGIKYARSIVVTSLVYILKRGPLSPLWVVPAQNLCLLRLCSLSRKQGAGEARWEQNFVAGERAAAAVASVYTTATHVLAACLLLRSLELAASSSSAWDGGMVWYVRTMIKLCLLREGWGHAGNG